MKKQYLFTQIIQNAIRAFPNNYNLSSPTNFYLIPTFLPWTENLQIQTRMTQQFLIESRYFKRGKQKHTIYTWKIFSEVWNITQRYRNVGTNKRVSPRDRWFVRLGRFSSGFRSRDLGILVCVYALIRADRWSRIVAYLKASVPRFRKPSV